MRGLKIAYYVKLHRTQILPNVLQLQKDLSCDRIGFVVEHLEYLFRKIRVITSRVTFVIDFAKNQVLKNNKILKIKGENSQQILLKRNLIEFITKIKFKKKSTKNYDIAVNDLKTCIKMHE